MRVLVVWEEGGDGTSLMPIECSYAELQKLKSWNGKFISHKDNTDALDNEMLEFFYHEDPVNGYTKLKFEKTEDFVSGCFDAVILAGML